MSTEQPDLFDLAPQRIEDVTLHQWDCGPHHALARLLHAQATPERKAAWWAAIIMKLRADRRRKKPCKA